MMSVSGEAPFTYSLFDSLDQNWWKSCSLIKCQTSVREAGITEVSVMDVEVGIRVVIFDVSKCYFLGVTHQLGSSWCC